jgi:phosphoribosylglycinamide formyltransferase-1
MSRVGVLISGRGTNLQALIDAQLSGELGGTIAVVISNNPEAPGLDRAVLVGIKTEVVTSKEFPARKDHDAKVVSVLKENNVNLVVLAGYMRILTGVFLSEYKGRIINVHPSLLPAFKGVNAQWQAVEYGVRYSGCTTHFVDAEMDSGPVILQSVVPVDSNDTGESLADRILVEEHKILVKSVRLFLEGKLVLKGRKVTIRE